MTILFPAIMSGGSGTRLWPLSRALHPKQFLSLAGNVSMLQQTVQRLAKIDGSVKPLIIGNNDHRFIIAEQLREIDVTPAALLLEPVGRNTAPAAALAALFATKHNEEAVTLLIPSDLFIADEPAFYSGLEHAVEIAKAGRLVTFGINPDRPETGFGYIRKGSPLCITNHGFEVASYVEKPDEKTATDYVQSGAYLWNSGMFVFRADIMLQEIEKFQPKMFNLCKEAFSNLSADMDFLRLDKNIFSRIEPDSIDFAVMEKTKLAAVVPLDCGWSDLGSWFSLWQQSASDPDDNVICGDVVAKSVNGSYLHSENGPLIAAMGLSGIVVVATRDAVLVVPKDKASDVRSLLDHLRRDGRNEVNMPSQVYRPWGSYQDIDAGPRFRVKRIIVRPGGQLSLQRHKYRAEHWVVVRGEAEVTRGDNSMTLGPDQSVYIPIGEVHRLENKSDQALHLIEVQTGEYVGEDDIERLEDIYGRS